jgi:hypothetical protein
MDIPNAEGNPLTVALDVTSSREATKKKLGALDVTYKRGEFHNVEYFSSDVEDNRPRGRTFMPRVVVGGSRDEIARLARRYGEWLRHSAIGSTITKEQAMERLRWHVLGGQLYEELLAQVRSTHKMMRDQLKTTATFKDVKRELLKERGRYLEELRRALDERYRVWQKERTAYMKRDKEAAQEDHAPNGVLDIILEST